MQQPFTLPDRPLVVRPPGTGLASRAWTLFVCLLLGAGSALLVIPPIGNLVTDFAIADAAQPVAGAKVEGRCSVHGGLIARCEATLSAGTVRRKVDYFFVDFHTGDFQVVVVADPARPELLTTNLALDKLWNRVLTLSLLGPLFALLTFGALWAAGKEIRAQRAIVRALTQKPLRTVLLRMDDYRVGKWTTTPGREWQVSKDARPIVMDPEQRLVLGITAGDGKVAMPLDNRLRWIGLDEDERRRLLEVLGPDRLSRWLAALSSPALDGERTRLRRRVRTLTLVALGFAALAGGSAWLAFSERDHGTGEVIALERGDEAPSSASGSSVRLRGVARLEHRADSTRIDARAAHLEIWVPVTGPTWDKSRPVTWIVEDVMFAVAKAGPGRWSGTLSAELPARAREALEAKGVVLAPTVRVLMAVAAPQDPLRLPALIAMALCGAIAVGLFLGTMILRVRVARMDAILR